MEPSLPDELRAAIELLRCVEPYQKENAELIGQAIQHIQDALLLYGDF